MEGHRRSIGGRRRPREMLIFILPNLFTTANLFCGYFSIISSVRGNWTASAFSIMLAAFADGLDGRVARLTNAQSHFGEEYDSMSDLVSFGVAPAILMHQWALTSYERVGWVASFLYLTCAALRLTRFNILKQNAEKRYFQGLASPIAACSVATAVLFYRNGLGGDHESMITTYRSAYMLAVMFVLALSMISTLRFRSFKDLKFSSQTKFGHLLLGITIMVLILATIEQVLFPIFVAYVLSGPLSELSRLMRRNFKWFPGKGRTRSP